MRIGWAYRAGLVLLVVSWLPGTAAAQVQQTGDDYVLEATVEALDAAGQVIVTATCRTLLGQEVTGAQAGRVAGTLADGTPVSVAVNVPACNRVLAAPTYWVVDDEMDASLKLGEGAGQMNLTWSHKGTQTIPVDRRAEVGTATLTLANGTVLGMRITLGAFRLPEPGL
jgi:hypothetical protein